MAYSKDPTLDPNNKNAGIIEFIDKQGENQSNTLLKELKPCIQPVTKIRSLAAKGQIFGFENYEDCQAACKILGWQYDQINTLGYIIKKNSMNWDHPEVQSLLKKVNAIKFEEIEERLTNSNLQFLTFAKKNYTKIYK